MSLTQSIHIQCDQCGTWLRDANSGVFASRQSAISYARIKGWTHSKGKRDLCPRCLADNNQHTDVNASEREGGTPRL